MVCVPQPNCALRSGGFLHLSHSREPTNWGGVGRVGGAGGHLRVCSKPSRILILNASRKSSKKALKKQRAVKELPAPRTSQHLDHVLARIVEQVSSIESGRPLHAYLETHKTDVLSLSLRKLVEGLIQSGLISEALQVTRWAYSQSVPRDTKCLNRFITLCAKAKDSDAAQEFFSFFHQYKLQPNVYSYNGLMSAFARCNRFDEALRVMKILQSEEVECLPDAFSFSSAISYSFKAENYGSVKSLFNEMISRGFQPDIITYNDAIRAACSLGDTAEVGRLMDCLKSDGLTPDAILYNSILHSFCMQGRIEDMEKFYDSMIAANCRPTSHTFYSLITAYSQANDIRKVKIIVKDLLNSKESFSSKVLLAIVQAYVKHGMYEEAEIMLHQHSSFSSPPDSFHTRAFNSLIEAYSEVGRCGDAYSFFKRMNSNSPRLVNTWTYTVIIQSFSKVQKMEDALNLVEEMEKSNLASDASYHVVMEGLVQSNELKKAESLIVRMRMNGIRPTTWTWNILIRGYLAAEQTSNIYRILKLMNETGCTPNEVTCLLLVQVYEKNGELQSAEKALMELKDKIGFDATMKAYGSLLHAYGRDMGWEEAENLFLRIQKFGHRLGVGMYNTMLNIYGRSGMLLKMESLFREMEEDGVEPNQVSYLSMIHAFTSYKYVERAEEIIKSMKRKGHIPSKPIFNTMISVYSKIAMEDNAKKWLQEMRQSGVKPDEFTFCARIGGHLKNHKVREAEFLIRNMQQEYGIDPPPFIRKWLQDSKKVNNKTRVRNTKKMLEE